ncbi:UNVERIFIED_CONTAM: hypothetical protein Scaly_1262300 [Sesamum calycinum]|uniref:Uncharacterized protein n=1 Tax=Sesamum calycinum TaxID=2727403 RepID=A0AAW2Q5K5_9LAMI
MASRCRRQQRWCPQPLTPLMEGPDFGVEDQEGYYKKESSWELIREWFRTQRNVPGGTAFSSSMSLYGPNVSPAKRQDLRLLLGVLGCPLAPIPISNNSVSRLHIKDIPLETSTAYYIIQQYLAATGCSKQQSSCAKNMYTSGMVKLVRCETEISTGKNVRTMGSRSGENGCFVLWQMSPGMWSLELAVGGHKVVAGSDGKIVWRHTPWLGTHAAKGPQRPLRRIIQGKTDGNFDQDKRAGSEEHRRPIRQGPMPRREANRRRRLLRQSGGGPCGGDGEERGPAEVIRHVLYGYFSQKSGLLIYMEDSHLTRVHSEDNDSVYWETTIGSSIGDYRDVDGVLIAHQGRTVVFRFGETSMQHRRTRMEEMWRIHDVVFNVPGLSIDSFIPPADIFIDTAQTVSP